MNKIGPASIAWTMALAAAAAAALVGILLLVVRIHRDPIWQSPGRAREAMAPARHERMPPTASPMSVDDAPAIVPRSPPPQQPVATNAVTPPSAIAQLRARRLTMPVAGVPADALTPSFAQARGSRSHEALDIMAAAGTPVVAVEDGTVAKLFTSVAGGLTVYQFDPSGTVAYYYAHLQRYADGLADGDPVRRGQVIGHVGSTGNANPAAPHLHFAIFLLGPERRWWEGTPVDPYPVLTR